MNKHFIIVATRKPEQTLWSLPCGSRAYNDGFTGGFR
jgi:hypothetical protein